MPMTDPANNQNWNNVINTLINEQEELQQPEEIMESRAPAQEEEIPQSPSVTTVDAQPQNKEIIPPEKKEQVTVPEKKNHRKRNKALLFFAIFFVLLIGGLALLGVYAVAQAKIMQEQATVFMNTGREAYAALKTQNLVETKKKLEETRTQFEVLKKQYNKYSWAKAIPFANLYYKDGDHMFVAGEAGIDAAYIAVAAIEPYADVLGFSGEGTFTGGSVENRLELALETLDKVMPVMNDLTSKLETVKSELSQIDETRYPAEVKGKKIREKIVQAKSFSNTALQVVTEGKPVLEVLPDIAGAKGQRKKYLVLFQNDKELRPTGGFLTAYATVFIEKGVVTQEKSDDIYELDKKFRKKPAAPEIIKTYLKTETQWNLRDMNLSPDFKTSMETFWSYFSQLPGEAHDIDGIIALDTNVLTKLVEVLGPIEVPGYGTFSAQIDKRCDCPQIIYALSEIVDRPTPYIRENRKGIIGPMMQSLIKKAYDAPKQQWPALFGAAWDNIAAKHVQFYFLNDKFQAAAQTIGAAGQVKPTPEQSDYFFVVDTNLGGAKSNMFVVNQVEHEVSLPENGAVRKTVTLTYKNPYPASNCNLEAGELCLNGTLTDWVRIYLPKDAKIEESLGFDDGTTKESEELDHKMYEGVFKLQPMNQAKVKLTYTVPYTNPTEYKVYVQKQGGSPETEQLFIVNGGEHKVLIDQDKMVTLPF